LKHLLIDVLKIDKSFIDDISGDHNDAALVSTIITLAHTVRLIVAAEGVETDEQLKILNFLKCDQLQGYPASLSQRVILGNW
jgi:diguanylate cyclase